jgi:mannosyltransferase
MPDRSAVATEAKEHVPAEAFPQREPGGLSVATAVGEDGAASASQVVLLLLVAGVFIAARLWRLTSYGLYGDEIFSLRLASANWTELIAGVARDVVHPPLFYMLLKIWMSVGGNSVPWLKLYPVLTSIASLPPLLLLCRELKMNRAAVNLALGLIAVNAYLVYYSQELRMYSLLLTLTAYSLWLFAKLINSDRASNWLRAALFIVNLMLVYTHYYGWLIVVAQTLFVLLWARRELKSSILSFALVALGFSPWAYAVVRAAIEKGGLKSNLGWARRPGLSDVFWYYLNLDGPITYRWEGFGHAYKPLYAVCVAAVLLFTYSIGAYGARVLRSNRTQNESARVAFIWLAMFSFLPVAISVLASHVLPQSVWESRFLIVSAPPYIILLAVSAFQLHPKWLKMVTVFVMMGWATLSGFTELQNREKLAIQPMVQRMINDETEQAATVPIYLDNSNVGQAIEFYLERADDRRFEIDYVDDFSALEGNHFWVASLKYRFDGKPPATDILVERGYRIGEGYTTESPGHKVFLVPVWRP